VVGAESTLELPVRAPGPEDDALPPFEAALVPAGLSQATVGGGPGGRAYRHDLADGSMSWTYRYVDGGNVVLPNGWESEEWNTVRYDVREDDPLSAMVRVRIESVLRRGSQGRFRIVTHGQMTCDATRFFVEDEVRVSEGEDGAEREVFARRWFHEAPRDCV
jgi:hypothetical protein